MKHLVSTFGASFLKGIGLGLGVLIVGGYGAFFIAYFNRVFPGVYLSTTNLSGLSINEALFLSHQTLDTYITSYPQVTLIHGNQEWALPTADLDLQVDDELMKKQLLSIGRTGNWGQQLLAQYKLLFLEPTSLPIPLTFDQKVLNDFVATTSALIDNPSIPPSVSVDATYHPETNSFIAVNQGASGEVVLRSQTVEKIVLTLSSLVPPSIALITEHQSIQATDTQLDTALARAKKLSQADLWLYFTDVSTGQEHTWQLKGKDLVSFLSVTDEFNLDALNGYIDSVAANINRSSQNALFQFDPTINKVTAFKPAIPGLAVQKDALSLAIREALSMLESGRSPGRIPVLATETEPAIDTGSVNDLGIEALLGKGESTYYNSTASRKHNVELAAAKLNGVLIPPGKTFSFNEHLGEVSLATGFQQAFVIRDGRTLLGDGGGVCQDSTTLFRAVLDAGLPITAWQNHSYRVGYYEQNSKPGFDATVYSPSPDFAFINDTPSYILIQTTASDMKLTYELYGTHDGREATISNYTQWDASPPPPDLHQDDPTLPAGVVKQVEKAVPGLKTKFDYTVTRDGETIFQKTFLSVFRPWQAVYLHGTKI